VLRRLREMSEIGAAIENFEAYVAGITSRVVDDAVRTCSPEWARLKHRVRYLVTHDDRFRYSGERQTVALAHGRGGRVRTAAAEALAARLAEIVTDVEGEMALDDIVSALAGDPKVPEGKTPWSDRSLEADPAATLESADMLRRLWTEIALLPPRQRAALLLHARDANGESVLRLLTSAGLISPADVGAALGVSERELAGLLDALPLTDNDILKRLGVTSQQVINLRKAARDRLARRMAR
jgi:DNA-directed RNA polymerase specialized sigma24 family protein